MHMLKALLFFCLLVLVGCSTTAPSVQRDPFDRTRPPDCVPLPPTPTYDPSTPTPTPNLATQMDYQTLPTPVWITVTPYPTPIDLSPKISNEHKMSATVYRCNGTWDTYILDPAIFPTAIPLSHGDIIYFAFPPIGLQPRAPTVQVFTSQP